MIEGNSPSQGSRTEDSEDEQANLIVETVNNKENSVMPNKNPSDIEMRQSDNLRGINTKNYDDDDDQKLINCHDKSNIDSIEERDEDLSD